MARDRNELIAREAIAVEENRLRSHSGKVQRPWIPACAGMTSKTTPITVESCLSHDLCLLELDTQGLHQLRARYFELIFLAHVLDRDHALGDLVGAEHEHEADARAVGIFELLGELAAFEHNLSRYASGTQLRCEFQIVL